ncbi:hypothetical protein CMO94_03935 [Candidatus Woesearchaeota archaeon]|jgi:small-conductance mechanosensitive channel|nr:hypothetical protein [Candidatus Woesearchaeota archaeon]|tara:strand:+ start:959 stop:1810 length:852 start_codon:yes stop_codon:yes gene_type:complete
MVNGTFIGNVSLQNFLLFIFIVIITFVAGGLLNRLIIKLLKDKVSAVVYQSLSKIVMYGVYAFGLYFASQKIINFDIPAALTALGILGLGLIFATLPLLQNIAAGIVIILGRPFKEDDIVEINGVLSKVDEVMLSKTKFKSLDGKLIIVPNIVFMTWTPIINYSRGEFIKVVLSFDVTYLIEKDKATKIIEKICHENAYILPNVPEKKLNRITKILEIPKNFFTIPQNIKSLTPQVFIRGVNKEKINLEVWFWIWDVLMKEKTISSFYENLMKEFKGKKIKFA